MEICVYSDGSATTADKPGGWAFLVLVDGVKVYEESGYLPKATNNVAEVTAALRGLSHVKALYGCNAAGTLRTIILRSDSQLVLGYASGRYQCKAMHLLPLYLQLRKLYKELNIKDEWIRGHSGEQYNERCDVLAKAAREGNTTTADEAAESSRSEED